MKRKLMIAFIASILCVSNVLGCGQTKEEKVAEKLQEEMGMDEEEAKELASEMVEMVREDSTPETTANEVENNDSENVEEQVEEVKSLEYAEPTQEILDANFHDFKFQVDTKVFHLDYDMTLKEVADLFEGLGFTVHNEEQDVLNLDMLVPSEGELVADEKVGLDVFLNDEECFTVGGGNNDLDFKTITLGECNYSYIVFNPNFSGAIYFAKGIPYNNLEMLEANENLSFSRLRDYLLSIGAEETTGLYSLKTCFYTQSGDLEYIITPVSDYGLKTKFTMGSEREYHYYSYMIHLFIDPNTGKCNKILFDNKAQRQREPDTEE